MAHPGIMAGWCAQCMMAFDLCALDAVLWSVFVKQCSLFSLTPVFTEVLL